MKKTLMVAMMLGMIVLSAPNKKFAGGTNVFAYEAGSGTPAEQKADIVFSSGFENDVSLNPPRKTKGRWEQFIAGSDEGYDWRTNLPGRGSPKNRFTYQEFVKNTLFRQHNLLNCNRLIELKALQKIINNALQRFTASRNLSDYA